jgi:voltage-gated potassium channel|tara:strand:+ start:3825 stop:4799 length:975 start_codon:yes stop_codon:yes gene_type:complete
MFLLLVIIFSGILGYMIIEEMTFFEAFYITIVTVSTVGFSDTTIVTSEGKFFTALLIMLSFGTFAYALTSISKYLLEGEYRIYFKDYQMNKEVEKLSGHVIVCGYGRVGTQAVNELNAHNKEYVIIEQSKELLDAFRANKQHLFLEGNATSDEILMKAQIENAQALITTLPSDADNLFVVLSARELNSNLTIISRASQGSSVRKLKIAGASNVIMPDSLGGAHMASLVITPDVIEFLDHITIQGDSKINLEEINFENIPEAYKNKTIASISQSFETGCNIVGYKTQEGDFIVNPEPSTLLVPGSKLFVLGKPEQINQINKIFGI